MTYEQQVDAGIADAYDRLRAYYRRSVNVNMRGEGMCIREASTASAALRHALDVGNVKISCGSAYYPVALQWCDNSYLGADARPRQIPEDWG